MKILYIANIRLPTEKAHGIQIMKMCEAFVNLGHNVELIVPCRFNWIKTEPFEYYGVKKNFKITKLPSLDLVKLGRIGFWIQSFSFAETATWYALFKKADIVYSRDELSLFNLCFLSGLFVFGGKKLFWEAHDGRLNFLIKTIIKKCVGVILITEGLKDFYAGNGLPREKFFVAPDGVDLEKFTVNLNKEECRECLNLPKDKKIIMYTGHLYDWKGTNTLADSARFFGYDHLFVFVGGVSKDVKKFKEKYFGSKNILIIGQKPHNEIPCYLKSADVLVIPNSGKEDISRLYTSPMKLFEYMASSNPIVASDLPSIREILNENNSILVEPDIPQALAEGIKKVLHDMVLSDKIASNALSDIKEYTWQKRADKIISFIKNCIKVK